MTTFWSAYIAILSLACWASVTGLLYWVLRIKPDLEEDGTTGHEYDGIKEYDKPMPRWWLLMFWGSIVFGMSYFILYPALGSYKGLLHITNADGKQVNWTSANELNHDLEANNAVFLANFKKNQFDSKDIAALAQDPKALKMGQGLFLQNCAVCHGSNAKGAKGYPNLTDTDWLYGGEPDTISTTIHKGRLAGMPTWQEKLGEDGVKAAAEYVLSLSYDPVLDKGLTINPQLAAQGKEIFNANCNVCHGNDAKGMHTTGAPNLTDRTWLYGGDRETVRQTIRMGRNGQMPAWADRLGDERIKLLTAYVYSLSQK